ncbi:MAG: aroB [Bacteroidetes bacterium]|jgi:3-dehydroquinate synthase|nr:aroB [Bacteroidota bacterium]
MKTLRIPVRLRQTRDRSYEISVSAGMMKHLPAILSRRWPGRRIFVISDNRVGRLYGRAFMRELLAQGADCSLLEFKQGEESKNSGTAYLLQSQLLRGGVKRDSLVVALGGGVVGDMAGYVAATVLRGIGFVQVPTTLLAQVDSSVGGKVGVDHPVGKNLIGAFHQPLAVFIDPAVLATLPDDEFRNGLAEIAKIAAGLDAAFFRRIERNAPALRKTDVRQLSWLIARAVGLKAAVVEKDELESGLRKALNLGHTIGHAVEASSGFAIKHGVAVAIGMAAEANLAVRLGLMPERDRTRLLNTLRALRLPTRLPRIRKHGQFLAALAADKKSLSDGTRFVLPSAIGSSAINVNVPREFIMDLLRPKP